MKKLVLLLIFIGFYGVQAQEESTRDKIKALETAHITEHLELSSQEAEKFWPIYNKYDKTNHELRKGRKNVYCNLYNENTSSEKAKELLQEYIRLEEKKCSLRKEMLLELGDVLPPQKIIYLKKVEDKFHKKLLDEYKARKSEKEII